MGIFGSFLLLLLLLFCGVLIIIGKQLIQTYFMHIVYNWIGRK